jgi:DNA invertase Pin-like site-specific DNA recombinase
MVLVQDPIFCRLLWYLENHIDLLPTSESDKIYSTLPDEFKPLLMGILTFLANMKREQLKQKISAGIELAKARGQKFGRKTKKPDFKKIEELKQKYGWSTRAALRYTGTNENTYYKYLKFEKPVVV